MRHDTSECAHRPSFLCAIMQKKLPAHVIAAIKEWWTTPHRRPIAQLRDDIKEAYSILLSNAEIMRVAADKEAVKEAITEADFRTALDLAKSQSSTTLGKMLAQAVLVQANRLASSGGASAEDLTKLAQAARVAMEISRAADEAEAQRGASDDWQDIGDAMLAGNPAGMSSESTNRHSSD